MRPSEPRSVRRPSLMARMKRGLNSLASIAAAAPFVGIFGTVLGIVKSFRGISGERTADLAYLISNLADSLVPTELGLLVAMLAFCAYKYFLVKFEDCDVEMRSASLQLLRRVGIISLLAEMSLGRLLAMTY